MWREEPERPGVGGLGSGPLITSGVAMCAWDGSGHCQRIRGATERGSQSGRDTGPERENSDSLSPSLLISSSAPKPLAGLATRQGEFAGEALRPVCWHGGWGQLSADSRLDLETAGGGFKALARTDGQRSCGHTEAGLPPRTSIPPWT